MRRILVVEDDYTLRDAYEMILSTQPYICDVASDGREALDMCAKNSYDLILLDLMMPVMNGIEFLENYPDLDKMKSKIIALSNLSSGREIDRVHQLGVERNLVKANLSPSELINVIRYDLDGDSSQP